MWVCVALFICFSRFIWSFLFVSRTRYRCHIVFTYHSLLFFPYTPFDSIHLKFNPSYETKKSRNRSHRFELQKNTRDWNTKWQIYFGIRIVYNTQYTHTQININITYHWVHSFKLSVKQYSSASAHARNVCDRFQCDEEEDISVKWSRSEWERLQLPYIRSWTERSIGRFIEYYWVKTLIAPRIEPTHCSTVHNFYE